MICTDAPVGLMSFLSELVLPWREAFLLRRFFRNLGKKDRKNKTGASSMR